MRYLKLGLMILGIGISLTACVSQNKVLPLHDEVLTFHLPYDLAYLPTVEALERVAGWELENTEKEKGLIIIRNINYSSPVDADKQSATFVVKRVGAKETSVELAPQSQRVLGGDQLLEQVSRYLDRELNK